MTDASKPPRPPAGARANGRRLWDSVVSDFDLDIHELALLAEAVRTVDRLDQLDQQVRTDGVMVPGRDGPRVHPALVESRLAKIALARVLAALRLPSGEEDARPQRRVGVRGTYDLGSNVRQLPRRSAS